jgi:hypothetical protein
MTISQMHQQFIFGLDKLDSLNYPNFLPEEIDLLLNQAQDVFVKARYGKNNPKRESFEETQKRTEDLKNITVNALLVPASNTSDNIDPNAQFVTLNSDHLFIIQERADITYTDCTGRAVVKTIEVRPIQHSEFSKIVKDPFKEPNKTKVLRLMENGKVELISDGSPILLYRLRYLQQPVQMNITTSTNCQLSEHTHQEIVNGAIQIALEGIEAKRNPTFTPIVENQQE